MEENLYIIIYSNYFELENITYNKTFFVSRYKVFTKNIAN